ncbi:hypothetical protein KIPB_016508, partial [Kipferlia bialata]
IAALEREKAETARRERRLLDAYADLRAESRRLSESNGARVCTVCGTEPRVSEAGEEGQREGNNPCKVLTHTICDLACRS